MSPEANFLLILTQRSKNKLKCASITHFTKIYFKNLSNVLNSYNIVNESLIISKINQSAKILDEKTKLFLKEKKTKTFVRKFKTNELKL